MTGPPPPPPPPPPPVVTSGKVTLLASTVEIENGKGGFSLGCAGTVPRCSGSLTLTATETFKRNGRKHRRTVTIGSATFSISAGRASVTVALNKTGHKLLEKGHGHLRATLRLRTNAPVTTSGAGQAVQLSRSR